MCRTKCKNKKRLPELWHCAAEQSHVWFLAMVVTCWWRQNDNTFGYWSLDAVQLRNPRLCKQLWRPQTKMAPLACRLLQDVKISLLLLLSLFEAKCLMPFLHVPCSHFLWTIVAVTHTWPFYCAIIECYFWISYLKTLPIHQGFCMCAVHKSMS